MLGDEVKNKLWGPLRAVMAMSGLSRVNRNELSRSVSPRAGHQGGRSAGRCALGEAAGQLFPLGGHAAGTAAHGGCCSCSQESLHHWEHLGRTSPTRQAMIIFSSASSQLSSRRKISVPGFQQEVLELGKGTSLLKR